MSRATYSMCDRCKKSVDGPWFRRAANGVIMMCRASQAMNPFNGNGDHPVFAEVGGQKFAMAWAVEDNGFCVAPKQQSKNNYTLCPECQDELCRVLDEFFGISKARGEA